MRLGLPEHRRFALHPLAQKIAKRDAKRLGDFGKDVEPPNLAITALDFAQPVFRPADQPRQNRLCQTSTTTIEGNPFANRQLIPGSSHAWILRDALAPPGIP